MRVIKYLFLFTILLVVSPSFTQNFIPKFIEPELSVIIDTTKKELPDLYKQFSPAPIPPTSFKMQEHRPENFPKDWEAFKRAFLALKMPKEYLYLYKNMRFMNQWERQEYASNAPTKARWNPLTPIQSFYDAFSKEAKEIRKYNQLKQDEYAEKLVGEKCPVEFVKTITGSVSDSMVYAFFNFCNFTKEQVEHATPYDLCVLITEKWELFIGRKSENAIDTLHEFKRH